MTKATFVDTTSTDFFLRGWHETYAGLGDGSSDLAEVRIDDVIQSAVARSGEIWAKPAQSWADVIERAKVAFYWNADAIDENGAPTLEDLHSTYRDKRSAAELIVAVLALDKKGAVDS